MIKRILPILILLHLLSCKDEILERLDYADISLIEVSGGDQEFVRGRLSGEPIIIKSVNKKGEAVPNIPIGWILNPQATTPNSEVSPFYQSDWGPYLFAEYVTDKEGFARCWLKVPSDDNYSLPNSSGNQMLEVRVTNPEQNIDAYDEHLFELNTLDKTYSYNLEILTGDQQTGKVLLQADKPIKLKLLENNDGSVWDYHVTFTSEATEWKLLPNTKDFNEELTGDSKNGYSTITDGNGELSVLWIFGREPGVQTLYANVYSTGGEHIEGSPFAITAEVVDLDVSLSYIVGKTQAVAAGTGLATPLTVRVLDENNQVVEGYEVKWETVVGQSLVSLEEDNPVEQISTNIYSSRSDKEGNANVRLITGSQTGDFEAKAHVYNSKGLEVSGSPITFDYSTYDKGSFLDSRDNETYVTIMFNGVNWFGENLNYQGGNAICYDNVSTNCEEFGALYTYEEALISCPTGWHLASDQEWKDLELYLGMDSEDIDEWGRRYGQYDLGLLKGEWSGLNLLFSGVSEDGVFYSGQEFQWTSDVYFDKPIGRRFEPFFSSLFKNRHTYETDKKFSVRCVED